MATIAAIASPIGAGGVGIIRISGSDALKILSEAFKPSAKAFTGFKPRFLHHGWLRDSAGEKIDECLAVYMPAPGTFTGEDVAEIHCHGSPLIVQWGLERCLELGARQAERGEFSRRAFLNGRLDLSQAEAIAELIAAPAKEGIRYSLERLNGHLSAKIRKLQEDLNELSAQACVAIDFPDDEVPALEAGEFIQRTDKVILELDELLRNAKRAAVFQTGSRILLIGPVNVGKSSLLNALSGRKRALVSEHPGTTRDFIEESLDFEGLPVRLLDSAGLRESADPIESLGIQQSLTLLAETDLIWLVLDASIDSSAWESILAMLADRPENVPLLLVLNKSDLASKIRLPENLKNLPACRVSALNGTGLTELIAQSRALLLGSSSSESAGLAPNARQALVLEEAKEELLRLREDLENGVSYDAALGALDSARAILDSILGLATHDELLDKIFSQFCIGK